MRTKCKKLKLNIQKFAADAEIKFQINIDSTTGEATIKKLDGSLEKLEKKVNTTSQSFASIFTGAGNAMSSAGSTLTKFVTAPVTALGIATAKTAIDFVKLKESSMGVFEKMLGGADAAENMYQSLLKIAKASTYSQEAFLTAGKTLVGMGTDAKYTEKYLQAITDAVAGFGGSSEDIESLASVFGKVSAKGKVLTDDLNMLAERGVNGLQILAAHYGVTTDEMQEMVSKGMVPAKEGLDILCDGMENGYTYAGQFHQGLSGMAQQLKGGTLTGALDSLKSSFRNMSIEMWDAFQNKPEIISAVNSIGEAMNKLPSIMGPITKAVGPMLTQFAERIKKVTEFAEKNPKVMENLVKVIMKLAVAGPILKVLGSGFTKVGKTIEFLTKPMSLFGKNFTVVSGALKIFGGIGKTIFSILTKGFGILTKLLPVIKAIGGVLMGPVGIILAIIAVLVILYKKCEPFRNLVNSIVSAVIGFLKNLWENIKTIVSNVVTVAKNIWTVVSSVLSAIWSVIKSVVTAIWNFLSPIFNFIKNAIILYIAISAMVIEWIYNLLVGVGTWIWNNVLSPIINFVTSAVQLVCNVVSTIVSWIWNNVLSPIINFFKTCISFVWNLIIQYYTFIFNLFMTIASWIWNNVLSPVINFFKSAFDWIWSKVSNVINKIKSAFQVVANVVKNVFNNIKSFISNIFSTIAGIIKAPINGVIGAINTVLRAMNKVKIPDWVPGLGGKGVNFSMIPKLSKGTNYVQQEGLAYLHQGEAVVPKKYNPAIGGQSIIVNVQADMDVNKFGKGFVREIKTFSGGSKQSYQY